MGSRHIQSNPDGVSVFLFSFSFFVLASGDVSWICSFMRKMVICSKLNVLFHLIVFDKYVQLLVPIPKTGCELHVPVKIEIEEGK